MKSTLFTMRESWHQVPWLFERLAFAQRGDTILLMQDGVLALNSALALGSFIAKCKAAGITVTALAEDCDIRGVNNHYPDVILIDYAEFVELVLSHARQVGW